MGKRRYCLLLGRIRAFRVGIPASLGLRCLSKVNGTFNGLYVIVDAQSGRVYWPFPNSVELGLEPPSFRLNSTLMIVENCPSPEIYGYKGCTRNYYNWTGSKTRDREVGAHHRA